MAQAAREAIRHHLQTFQRGYNVLFEEQQNANTSSETGGRLRKPLLTQATLGTTLCRLWQWSEFNREMLNLLAE
jgi:hypothetical protein